MLLLLAQLIELLSFVVKIIDGFVFFWRGFVS